MYFLKGKRKNGKQYLIRVYENHKEAIQAMRKTANSFVKPSKSILNNNGATVQTF